MPAIMRFDIETEDGRKEWRRFIEDSPPAQAALYQKLYDEQYAAWKERQSKSIKEGIQANRAFREKALGKTTPTKAVDHQSESNEQPPGIVPVGPAYSNNREKLSRPPEIIQPELDRLSRQEIKEHEQVKEWEHRLAKKGLSDARFDEDERILKERIQQLSRTQNEIRALGGTPRATATRAIKSATRKAESLRERRDEAKRKEYERLKNEARNLAENARYESWALVPVGSGNQREYAGGEIPNGGKERIRPPRDLKGASVDQLKSWLEQDDRQIEKLRKLRARTDSPGERENAESLLNKAMQDREAVLKELGKRPTYKQEKAEENRRQREQTRQQEAEENRRYKHEEASRKAEEAFAKKSEEREYKESQAASRHADYMAEKEFLRETEAARHADRMEYAKLLQKQRRARDRRETRRAIRRSISNSVAGAGATAYRLSKYQKAAQASAYARRRPKRMAASRVPARQSYFDPGSDYPESIHDTYRDRVIAAGGVEVVWFAAASMGGAAFLATRQNDVVWSLGTMVAAFFAAGGAREDATIRDLSLGLLSAGAAVLTLRAIKPKAFSGQQ